MSRSTSTRGSDSYSQISDESSSRSALSYTSAPRLPFSEFSKDTDDTFPVANVKIHHDGPTKEIVLYIICGSTIGIVLASVIVYCVTLSFNFLESKIFETLTDTILPLSQLTDEEKPVGGILGYLYYFWQKICKFFASRLKDFLDTYGS